jgi:acetolactate synthase-1/2/3 large subunit
MITEFYEPKIKLNKYQFLLEVLTSWGVTSYSGVTGGGVIHFLKHLKPLQDMQTETPSFFTISEYVAGFIPLGYYLTGGKIAASVATTGAATKLLTCGLSDAKLHNIPSIYIVPITNKESIGFSTLQDTSVHGSNIVEQLRAELPNSVFILDNPLTMTEQLALAKEQLNYSKPIVLILDNSLINSDMPQLVRTEYQLSNKRSQDFSWFITDLRKASYNKRLVILVGEEMANHRNAAVLTSQLSEVLKAATIWSINGANAISPHNRYGYGYISFGGNDKATELYDSLGETDVLLILGACPDEYTTNLSKFTASHTFFVNDIVDAYGLVDNSLRHVADGIYHQIQVPLEKFVAAFIENAKEQPFLNLPATIAPDDLNNKAFSKPRDGYVNMADLYLRLDKWWPAGSIGVDDVCLAYKDRQYVTQRPNKNIRFFSLYRGSAMGGAFGAAIGAKLSKPHSLVALFTGDGCFRLFAGSLGEAAELGLVIFLLNNETLSIVEQGLQKILPDIPEANYHATVISIDYCKIAKACGWDAIKLKPDLSNLKGILQKISKTKKRSLLIEVPVDPLQILGNNPRLGNL